MEFDVVIVGGGPIGSNLACNLSKSNLSICLIEKKDIVGVPLQCAGIVSKHILDYINIPQEIILNQVKGAFLHSQNNILKVNKEDPVAIIIDRIKFDQYLFDKAISSGVTLLKNTVVDVDSINGTVKCIDGQLIKGKIIVGSDGFNSIISKKIGNELENINATQFLVKIDKEKIKEFRNNSNLFNDYIDVQINDDILPGFIWVIPYADDSYRIGLFSDNDFDYQTNILNEFLNANFKDSHEILRETKGIIPKYNQTNKLTSSRVILLGDSSSKIKPTTGGGLVIGFDLSKIAEKYIIEATEKNNIAILNEFDNKFNDKYFDELNYQLKLQKTFAMFSNEDFDHIFKKLKENGCESLISDYGHMDKQSILIKEFLKRGLFFKLIPSFFMKKLSNMWNSTIKE
ncbi:geranylgeranyl reductase family protein [Methanobrevibacter sp. DSM 116169]|uniref:geranylgeranyl reductase family protein n=1 Tax=Methanobrevibacter sp. DSM 116169 TaxID=3242727 RepID=UPI0038FCFFC5